ncbi:hypothetical protein RJ641_020593 [Dillenia turbinata]|uniref:Uncharacterized protein n=1 Tax=Dillenia turbinata TaxID=194707 RepID=A0AAN8UQ92_9MAGN
MVNTSTEDGQIRETIEKSYTVASQVQSYENQMNPQWRPMKLQNSITSVQLNNVTNVQQNSLSSLSASPAPQQNMMNSLKPTSNLDSEQGGSLSSSQQVAIGSLLQNPVGAPQQASVNTMTSQSVCHQRHQQMMQQKQQMTQQHQQQLHQKSEQQQLSQIQGHQMPQIHQMNGVNNMKMRQMGVKPGAFQQHHSAAQRTAYHHQQLKPVAPFPISSPLLQSASLLLAEFTAGHGNHDNASTLASGKLCVSKQKLCHSGWIEGKERSGTIQAQCL